MGDYVDFGGYVGISKNYQDDAPEAVRDTYVASMKSF
jgi:hypothetical protein